MEDQVNQLRDGNSLILIPRIEKYIEYMLNVILKLPRIEKFNIGNEYKLSMYQMLEETMMLNKVSIRKIENKNKMAKYYEKEEYLHILNKIDALLNCQRIYLRIMDREHYIDHKKFNVAMEHTYEIGKIIGGLYRYYAKNNS